MAIEGAEADIALSSLAEPCSWGTYDIRLLEQKIEELPRIHACLHPHIRGMVATDTLKSQFAQRSPNTCCVNEVVIAQFPNLILPFGRIHGFGGTLDRIGHPIELGRMTAIPERMQRMR